MPPETTTTQSLWPSISHFNPSHIYSLLLWLLFILQKSLERLDDASTELMMAEQGDKVMLLIGESFFETSETSATEYCEAEVERMQAIIETVGQEESGIVEQQAELKKALYGRFGKSIQLEEK
jgi:prefoldin subunit 4